MLARFSLLLPFTLDVPEGESFNLYNLQLDDGIARILIPGRSEVVAKVPTSDQISIDGKVTFKADVLIIEFEKENFERSINSNIDPSENEISEILNWFLNRLRLVCNAPKIYTFDYFKTNWSMKYFNDDGTELEAEEGKLRERRTRLFSFNCHAITPQVWNDVFKEWDKDITSNWYNLLLDAQKLLPEIGPAVVLAHTALEVLILEILNNCAKDKISEKFWQFIKQKNKITDAPTTKEQFDILLEEFCGISLKSNSELWKAFGQLQDARHSFVHEGIAKKERKKKNSIPLNLSEATILISKAKEISDYIRNFLPENLKWPIFEHKVKIEFIQQVIASPKEKQNA